MQLPPRWQWKINRARQKWAERWDRTRTLAEVARNQQRMCPSCRALVDRGEALCPMCNSPMQEVPHGTLGRSVDLALPSHGRITYVITLINGLLFLLTLISMVRAAQGEFNLSRLLGGVDGYTLLRYGAKYGPLIADGDWWRLVAPIFLHGSILHLVMNSYVLLDLGPAVEGLYGRAKFLVMYVICGIAGVLGSYLWRPEALSIGASGAIFGLIGVMIGRSYQYRAVGGAERSMFVRSAVIMLVIGWLVPVVDNAAHIGGLVAGLALGYFVEDAPAARPASVGLWRALKMAMILLVVASFAMVAWNPPFGLQ